MFIAAVGDHETPVEPPLQQHMPGYKALPSFMTGDAADQVREAEARHRIGDSIAAVSLLEEALAASVALRPVYPGWLCGRLAALYRTLGRYDDEVHLLERYRDSQTSEEARTRYDARLCKARTIAERKRRRPSGALDSVRASLGRPRTRRSRGASPAKSAAPTVSAASLAALTAALHATDDRHETLTIAALQQLTAEGHAAHAPVELLVSALKTATSASNGIPAAELSGRYSAALVHLLALYFEEDAE
jgi:hypothetical protein